MRILVGMSGGVDSCAAALLLIKEGHEVAGACLVMHGTEDVSAAREACDALGIPLYVEDCREMFSSSVIPYFADEYFSGRTPNPCVVCNSEVKFKALLAAADKHGFDRIATGHYASVLEVGERYAVRRAEDRKKDQAYMLWRLPQSVLSRLVMPLSDLTKVQVREICKEAGLSSASRADSQEICFIPDGEHAAYLERLRGACPEGDFIDPAGKVIGRHKGIIRYTVGQRKGLGIAAGHRIFVTAIDAKNNTVTVSDEDKLYTSLTVSGVVCSGLVPDEGREYELTVKVRYLAPDVPCRVKFYGNTAHILLSEPQRAVAPGQSAVLYLGNTVAAGGFIDSAQ